MTTSDASTGTTGQAIFEADGLDQPQAQERSSRTPATARALGWLSLGLGAAQEAAPDAVSRLVGVRATRGTRALVRGIGARELASGAGLLSRRRPIPWLWGRVAGDLMDLTLLGRAVLAEQAGRRRRVATAAAAVAGITAVDVVAASRFSRAARSGEWSTDGVPRNGEGKVRTSVITVNRPPSEVYRVWRDLEGLPRFMTHLRSVTESGDGRSHWVAAGPAGRSVEWDAEIVHDVPEQRLSWRSLPDSAVRTAGEVRFVPAPGDRGTEVHVRLAYRPPGGPVGAAVAALFGEEPGMQIGDELRRFKQVLETGEVLRSEGTPEGTRAARQVLQRPAHAAQ